MEVGSRRIAGGADKTNPRALTDALSFTRKDFRQVSVQCLVAVCVLDDDVVSKNI